MVTKIKNYTNRKVDIFIMALPESFTGEAKLLFTEKVKICTGVQKLVQIYVIQLLTAVNSKLLGPTEGTLLGDTLIGLTNPTRDEMRHILNIANAEVKDLILAQQTDLIDAGEVLPDDEIFVDSKLTSLLIVDNSSIQAEIQIDTQAGEQVQFVVPISFSLTG